MTLKDENLKFPAIPLKVNLGLTILYDVVQEKNIQDQFPYKLNKDGFVMPPANLDGWIIDPYPPQDL
jgi:hypothetical protein